MLDTAIADVSDTLINLLRDNMEDLIPNRNEIALISPGEIGQGDIVRLTLFMYRVIENIHMKNQDMEIIDSTHLKYPPLTLDLHYMLTSHPLAQDGDRTGRTLDEQRILGRAMRILYDSSVLLISDDEIRISTDPLSLDDMTKIWTTFQNRPFRPSACYLVTPVKIDSMRDMSVKRVERKETESGSVAPERKEE